MTKVAEQYVTTRGRLRATRYDGGDFSGYFTIEYPGRLCDKIMIASEDFADFMHIVSDDFAALLEQEREQLIRLRDAFRALHEMANPKNPNDPIGVALKKIGMEHSP